MKKVWLVVGLVMVLLMSACTSAGTSGDTAEPAVEEVAVLHTDYEDALSVQGQLALGTVRLEETEWAVDEGQAAELLPLWRALQSLSGSDTTAAAELEAVVKQIQETMTPGQLEAIKAMALTTETMTEMMERGELGLPGGGPNMMVMDGEGLPEGASFSVEGPAGGGFAAGAPADAVVVEFGPGGPPPGGGPGPGSGAGPGMMVNGELSEEDMVTRQAAFESGDFQERLLMGLAIRLLAEKTGEVVEMPGAAIGETVYRVVSEATGLSVAELEGQTAEGQTLAEIIEASGGDVEAVQATLATALEELADTPEDMDAAQMAAFWLGIQPEPNE
jgi:hypothetical protein